MQDNYALEESELEFPSVILENEYLEAVFLPTLGGRIWSLYDKVEKRDLVTRNPVFKPGNFAVRNAWVAGGIEWNIGRRGHDARTSSPLFAAQLSLPDGTPVLRLYEFCRDRAATYQMDFSCLKAKDSSLPVCGSSTPMNIRFRCITSATPP